MMLPLLNGFGSGTGFDARVVSPGINGRAAMVVAPNNSATAATSDRRRREEISLPVPLLVIVVLSQIRIRQLIFCEGVGILRFLLRVRINLGIPTITRWPKAD